MVITSQNQLDSANTGQLIGHPAINRRGRPQTQRITGALEGRARGGGAKRTVHDVDAGPGGSQQRITRKQHTRCEVCREIGHNCLTCPILQNH